MCSTFVREFLGKRDGQIFLHSAEHFEKLSDDFHLPRRILCWSWISRPWALSLSLSFGPFAPVRALPTFS